MPRKRKSSVSSTPSAPSSPVAAKASAARDAIAATAASTRDSLGAKSSAARDSLGAKASSARDSLGAKASSTRDSLGTKAFSTRDTLDSKAASARNALARASAEATSSKPSVAAGMAQLPLLLLLNILVSTSLHTFVARFTDDDLARVSRPLDDSWHAGALLAVKAAEVVSVWLSGLDGRDAAALAFIARFPTAYILGTFYSVRPALLLATILADVISVAWPLRLFRPARAVHSRAPTANAVANRAVITDRPILLTASLLAAAVPAVLLQVSAATWLPQTLAAEFDGMYTLEPIYSTPFWQTLLLLLPLGVALEMFLFTPSEATPSDAQDARWQKFVPSDASFAETLRYTFFGWTAARRTLIRRTVGLAFWVALNTSVQLAVTIAGASPYGAALWAALWADAIVGLGLVFAWIGNADGFKKSVK